MNSSNTAPNGTDARDTGPHRVVYTEFAEKYTRRHGTGAFDTKEEAEESRQTIEGLDGYGGAHVMPCHAGDTNFSDAAQPREGALPRVKLHPYVNEEEAEHARFVEAHPGQTLTWGAVWIHVIVEFIDPYAKQPEEAPPNTMRVLAGHATPEPRAVSAQDLSRRAPAPDGTRGRAPPAHDRPRPAGSLPVREAHERKAAPDALSLRPRARLAPPTGERKWSLARLGLGEARPSLHQSRRRENRR